MHWYFVVGLVMSGLGLCLGIILIAAKQTVGILLTLLMLPMLIVVIVESKGDTTTPTLSSAIAGVAIESSHYHIDPSGTARLDIDGITIVLPQGTYTLEEHK